MDRPEQSQHQRPLGIGNQCHALTHGISYTISYILRIIFEKQYDLFVFAMTSV
jgi:hypothetical protein